MKTIREYTIETLKNDSEFIQNTIKDLERILDTMVGMDFTAIDSPIEVVVSSKISPILMEYDLSNERKWEEVFKEVKKYLRKEKLDEVNYYLRNNTAGKARYLYGELLYQCFSEYQHYIVELQSRARNRMLSGIMTGDEFKILLCEHEELILKSYK